MTDIPDKKEGNYITPSGVYLWDYVSLYDPEIQNNIDAFGAFLQAEGWKTWTTDRNPWLLLGVLSPDGLQGGVYVNKYGATRLPECVHCLFEEFARTTGDK